MFIATALFGCGGAPAAPADPTDLTENIAEEVTDVADAVPTDPITARLAAMPEMTLTEGTPPSFKATPAAVTGFAAMMSMRLNGALQQAEAGPCPAMEDDGSFITFTANGCEVTDSTGATTRLLGTARAGYRVDEEGKKVLGKDLIELNGWGDEKQIDCGGTMQTSRTEHTGSMQNNLRMIITTTGMALSADGTCSAGDTVVIDYGLPTRVENADGSDTWNGSGTIGGPDGRFTIETIDEVTHSDSCRTEPMSGRTIIRAGGREAVVTYDGATSCDDPGMANWSLDGADQGQTVVPRCSAGGDPSGFFPALLALLFVRRRRTA